MMDGKRHKHIDIYNSLEPKMKEIGFINSGTQMKIKLKHLKEMYFKCKRNNNTSGAIRQTFPFYDAMEQLFGRRPSVQAIDNTGIDSSGNNVRGINSSNNNNNNGNNNNLHIDIILEQTQEEASEIEDNTESSLENEIENNDIPVPNNIIPSRKIKKGG